MINWSIVWAIVIRHIYNFRHSWDRVADAFYWPAMNILLWGFTTVYVSNTEGSLSFIVISVLSGIILWMLVWRSQYEITVNLLEEMWNDNMMNLFASPLRIREWILGVFILGLLGILVSVSFASLFSYFLYKVNIFSLGFYLIPFMVSLVFTGWATGLMVAGLIIRFGIRIQTLAWTGVSLIAPFSGVYYPISTLPKWAQDIAYFLPTTYIFEGMREVLFHERLPIDMLIKSFSINFLLLILGVWFFSYMFNKAKDRGIARSE